MSDAALTRWAHNNGLPAEVEAYVQAHGTEQPPSPVPPEWRPRRHPVEGRCYTVQSWSGEATYTEGRARCAEGWWLPHAWLTGADGRVIDLSWPWPGREYFGVQLDHEVVQTAIAVNLRHGFSAGALLPVIVGIRDGRTLHRSSRHTTPTSPAANNAPTIGLTAAPTNASARTTRTHAHQSCTTRAYGAAQRGSNSTAMPAKGPYVLRAQLGTREFGSTAPKRST